MRLTRILFSGRRNRPGGARGNKKTGKHQEPHVIRSREREIYVKNLLQECTNEMWLTRPYLSRKQENLLTVNFKQKTKGSPVVCVDEKSQYEHRNLRYRINVKPHVSFEERWSHANVAKQWKPDDKDLHKKLELERFARAVLPKRYPDFYPRYVEKWNEWNKIEGFGLKKNNFLPVPNETETNK